MLRERLPKCKKRKKMPSTQILQGMLKKGKKSRTNLSVSFSSFHYRQSALLWMSHRAEEDEEVEDKKEEI